MSFHSPDYKLERVLIKYFQTALTDSTGYSIYQRYDGIEKHPPYISFVVTESTVEEGKTGNWFCDFDIYVDTDLIKTSTFDHDETCGEIIDEFFKADIATELTQTATDNEIELTVFYIEILKKRNEINEHERETIISGKAYLMPDNIAVGSSSSSSSSSDYDYQSESSSSSNNGIEYLYTVSGDITPIEALGNYWDNGNYNDGEKVYTNGTCYLYFTIDLGWILFNSQPIVGEDWLNTNLVGEYYPINGNSTGTAIVSEYVE